MVASGAGQVSHTKCSACKWHWVSHCIVIKTVLFIARGSRGFLEELREDLHWLTPPLPPPPPVEHLSSQEGWGLRVLTSASQFLDQLCFREPIVWFKKKKTKTTNQNKTNNLFRLLFFFIVEKYILLTRLSYPSWIECKTCSRQLNNAAIFFSFLFVVGGKFLFRDE